MGVENDVTDDALFVTGTMRSGTTLLEKLLGSQQRLTMLSQPFPLLFVEAKRAFLRSQDIENERYPLGHLFLESRYDRAALDGFLGQWRTSYAGMKELFSRMREYSGQGTRFAPDDLATALSQIEPDDDLAAVVAKLDRLLATRPGAEWFGSKEIVCEELLPYLLDRGFRCAIIIRDPRDVVASLNHGRGHEFGGQVRPTLFNVRIWRKSVAFALELEGRPRFHWCRYEDLVADPAQTLSRLAAALQVDPLDATLHSQQPWNGNSSFTEHAGVSAASVGVHRNVLPAGVAEEIEAACLPELRLLGYQTSMTKAEAVEVIHRFCEPYAVRRDLEGDLATPENAALEAERLDRLRYAGGLSRQWFLFERAETRLRRAMT